MLRASIVGCALLLSILNNAKAAEKSESPVERGAYLVNTIMACGNCHTPRNGDGKPIADKALSGGLTFDTPAFVATAPNITPDKETGIGSWSDAEIRRALVEGSRPDHGRLAGVHLAAIMPANFCAASSRSATRWPIPSIRCRCAATPIPMRTPASARRRWPIPSGTVPISSP